MGYHFKNGMKFTSSTSPKIGGFVWRGQGRRERKEESSLLCRKICGFNLFTFKLGLVIQELGDKGGIILGGGRHSVVEK